MERTYISDLKEKIGKEVRIRGRVDTIRDQGKIIFIIVREKTGEIQTVAWHQDKEVFEKAKLLTQESIVDIYGEVKEAKQVEQGYEVAIKELLIDSLAQTPLPVTLEDEYVDNVTALDKRLDYRWIDLRTPKNQLMIKVTTLVGQIMRTYCVEKGLKEIQGPRIISAASEGGANVFEVKYFESKAYLAQSPQFHKQMGIAADLEGVFNMGPVFRAEKSFTTRHLTEYTSFDVELGYIDTYEDVMAFEMDMIKKVLKEVKEEYGDEIKERLGVEVTVPEEIPTISVKEAKEKLAQAKVHSKSSGDFSPEEEKALGEIIEKETGSEFFFMTDYPHASRAFYHMKDREDPSLALGFDLFWRGLEITTGAQREHREEQLILNAKDRGIKEEELEEYFEYFRYGCPPHGGFAIGIERFVMKLLDLNSILEATYLPNTPNRIGKLLAKRS
jgi:nondiscriminating aspartyl-tRNA synthetase